MKKIAARYIYTLQDDQPIENGYIIYNEENGEIVEVGKLENAESAGKVQEKTAGETEGLDCEYFDGAITPGFVNTHCHLELSYLKGKFRKGSGMAGFIDQINALRDSTTQQEKLRSISDEADAMWKKGVQALGDISNCADTFEIKSNSPIYFRTFLEVFGSIPEESDGVIDFANGLCTKAREEFSLDAAPTPHSCYTMCPELIKKASAEALKEGFLSYHSEETQQEEDMMIYGKGKMYDNRLEQVAAGGFKMPPIPGKTSLMYFIDLLEEIHKPPFKEHILLVHEVCMNQEGIDRVKEVMHNAYIALCPLSNIFIHNQLPPVELMRKNNLKLTIGTDSLSSNDDLDIVKEMFCLQENFNDLSLGELLTWASRNGAEFLNIDSWAGSIEKKKKPGLVLIDHLSLDARLTSTSSSRRLV